MDTKPCSKCNVVKPLAEFSKSSAQCFQCRREYDKVRQRTEPRRKRDRERQAAKRAKNHKQWRARWTVENALRTGKLIRAPCSICGEPKADAHHDDYDKPLDVRWLCRTHHAEHHRLNPRPA